MAGKDFSALHLLKFFLQFSKFTPQKQPSTGRQKGLKSPRTYGKIKKVLLN
jgi:hypothetical protein